MWSVQQSFRMPIYEIPVEKERFQIRYCTANPETCCELFE